MYSFFVFSRGFSSISTNIMIKQELLDQVIRTVMHDEVDILLSVGKLKTQKLKTQNMI